MFVLVTVSGIGRKEVRSMEQKDNNQQKQPRVSGTGNNNQTRLEADDAIRHPTTTTVVLYHSSALVTAGRITTSQSSSTKMLISL